MKFSHMNIVIIPSLGSLPYWWLGTRHDVVEGAWEWSSTGKPLSIFDWGPNQPCNGENNQDCLQIWHKSDYLWDDEFCTLRHNYIYESRRLLSTRVGVGILSCDTFSRKSMREVWEAITARYYQLRQLPWYNNRMNFTVNLPINDEEKLEVHRLLYLCKTND